MSESLSKFLLFSPTDYRYSVESLAKFLSEEAYVNYKARVEAALAKQLCNFGLCSEKVAKEIEEACNRVTAKEVYEEERKTKHDVRALVNVIRSKVSDVAKPYVHLTATSYDIVDTANSLRYRDAITQVLIPDMVVLEKILIQLSRVESNSVQIGRTHGQHAEPITFGFAVALYVSRWGSAILQVKRAVDSLVGKFSGAVGSYGSSSLITSKPEEFERALLKDLGLRPAEISSQIVPAEPMTNLIHSVVLGFGVLANLARDMRSLQRSEIAEISERFEEKQVGSSTMPHKRNPINFENVESMWKEFMPHMVTMYMDQISEHQRDLTNSASQRYTPEVIVGFDSAIRRMISTLYDERTTRFKIVIDRNNIRKNLEQSSAEIVSEPLYLLLALKGHPDAHEVVRQITIEAESKNVSVLEVLKSKPEVKPFIEKLTTKQREMLENPKSYSGIASHKARKVASAWELKLKRESLW
jgi:adenylosuccinate lyase